MKAKVNIVASSLFLMAALIVTNIPSAMAESNSYEENIKELKSESESHEEDIEELIGQIKSLQSRLDQIESGSLTTANTKAEKSSSGSSLYTPKVFGAIVAYYNVSCYNGDQRFVIRNTRFGVKGNAAERISYGVQVDFHNLGAITMLDAKVTYTQKNFDVTLGQQQIHLNKDLDDGATTNLFVTRSYSAIFSTIYFSVDDQGAYSVKSIGSRDIGIYSNYKFDWDVPVVLSVGAFNGNGINNVTWNDGINLNGKISVGANKGLRGSASIYTGHSASGQDMTIWSGEMIYNGEHLVAESNYVQRRQRDDDGLHLVNLGVVQGMYKIPMPNSRLFEYYAPALRWDIGDNVPYINSDTSDLEFADVNRLSASMNFFFAGATVRTRLSLGYEKVYMGGKLPSDIDDNPTFQDKVNVGLTVCF